MLFIIHPNYLEEKNYDDELEENAQGHLLYSNEELIDFVKNVSIIQKAFESKHRKLKDYFNMFIDGNLSDSLLKYLKLI